MRVCARVSEREREGGKKEGLCLYALCKIEGECVGV